MMVGWLLSGMAVANRTFILPINHTDPRDGADNEFQLEAWERAGDGRHVVIEIPDVTRINVTESYSPAALAIADRLNASLVRIEIRGFGLLGKQPPPELCTLKQTLMDFAIAFSSGWPQARIHVMGGGAGGTLAAMMHARYPNIVASSWASSSPILSFPFANEQTARAVLGCLGSDATAMLFYLAQTMRTEGTQSVGLGLPNVAVPLGLHAMYAGLELMWKRNDQTHFLDSFNASTGDFGKVLNSTLQYFGLSVQDLIPGYGSNASSVYWRLRCLELGGFSVSPGGLGEDQWPAELSEEFYVELCRNFTGVADPKARVDGASQAFSGSVGRAALFTAFDPQGDPTAGMVLADDLRFGVRWLSSRGPPYPYADLFSASGAAIDVVVTMLNDTSNGRCRGSCRDAFTCICDTAQGSAGAWRIGEWCDRSRANPHAFRRSVWTLILTSSAVLVMTTALAWMTLMRDQSTSTVARFRRAQ